MRLTPNLLQKLVCPISRTALRYDEHLEELISDEAGVAYPVRQGVPILLAEEARMLSEEERHGGPGRS